MIKIMLLGKDIKKEKNKLKKCLTKKLNKQLIWMNQVWFRIQFYKITTK